MKTNIRIIGILCAVLFTFSACDTLTQMASLVNCKYELGGLANPQIAGISLNNTTNVNNLNAMSLVKLTAGIMSGSLPLSFDVNVKTTNPNSTQAQLAGLEWALDLDNANLLTGMVNKQISIPANGSATIPFTVQTDVMKLMKGQSKENIMGFLNNILTAGESSSRVALRIKPTVMIANQKLSTGFITLSKTIN